MKRLLRILFFVLLGLMGIVLLAVITGQWYFSSQSDQFMQMATEEAPLMEKDGFPVRDLNKNGLVDTYEDPSAPIEARVENLLLQMSVKEKAGMMAHTIISPSEDGELVERPGPLNPSLTSDLVLSRNINHFNFFEEVPVRPMVEWHNKLQKLAERTRLGIPITISSDPRHSYQMGNAANMTADNFSKWPDQLGLAAIGDSQFVADFGRIAREEYLALGIRTALHPMADLATEPRWARISGTFGEDAQLAKKLMAAYVYGFQGDSLHKGSVACMSKHWPGGGPQKNGEDAHFAVGKEQVYPGGKFDYHKIPFEGAFEAGTAQIMPYYGLPEGIGLEEVGFNYNKEVLKMLRDEAGFEGVICSDWAT
ncbi:MAG: glycoside hydrolase family 3 N-terminal domain-containing protein, partial [Bacteroidota bacterium]